MKSPSRLAVLLAVLFAAVAILHVGCIQKEKEGESAEGGETSAAGQATDRKQVMKASEDDCVGPLTRSKKPREIAFSDHRFKLDGYLLTQLDEDPGEEVVLGVVSDTKENTEENRNNLDLILKFFAQEKVEFIIHLGDVASTMPMPEEIDVPEKDEKGKPLTDIDKERYRRRVVNKARREAMARSLEDIVEIISLLAESDLPVLVLSGNRECKTTFNSAMATLTEDFPNVFNMNAVRRVDLDDVDIISMPGYHDPEYVHCSWDKCLYYESDTLSLIELAKEANDPVLAISHGPPRQHDRNGIDVVSEGANVGNPALAAAIEKAKIPFGAFGNIQEAGGKAVNLDGTSQIAQNTFVNALYLNPGPGDSMIWTMNDESESRGMAAVIKIVGKKASYKVYRIGQETKAPAPAPTPAPAPAPAPEKKAP
jgi:Icc-related predicted phosphoesterase